MVPVAETFPRCQGEAQGRDAPLAGWALLTVGCTFGRPGVSLSCGVVRSPHWSPVRRQPLSAGNVMGAGCLWVAWVAGWSAAAVVGRQCDWWGCPHLATHAPHRAVRSVDSREAVSTGSRGRGLPTSIPQGGHFLLWACGGFVQEVSSVGAGWLAGGLCVLLGVEMGCGALCQAAYTALTAAPPTLHSHARHVTTLNAHTALQLHVHKMVLPQPSDGDTATPAELHSK